MVSLIELKDAATDFISTNAIPIAVGTGAAIVGGGILAATLSGSKSKRRTHTKRGWKMDRKRFNKSQKWEVAYRKRKRARTRRKSRKNNSRRSGKIKYTKKGQPYIILKNGRARFIKGKRRKK